MSPGTVSTERKRRYVNVQKPNFKKKKSNTILKNLQYTNTSLLLSLQNSISITCSRNFTQQRTFIKSGTSSVSI